MNDTVHAIEDDIDAVRALYGPEARKRSSCNCSAPDIDVGILHEPTCGDPEPEEIVALISSARLEGWRA